MSLQHSVLNVKALVGAFNQENALVGAFSVIVKTDCETDGSFYSTNQDQDTVCRQQMGATPTLRCTGQCGHSLLMSFKSATLVHCNKYQQTFFGLYQST